MRVIIIFVMVGSVLILQGCQTCKGVDNDSQSASSNVSSHENIFQKMDNWLKEVLW